MRPLNGNALGLHAVAEERTFSVYCPLVPLRNSSMLELPPQVLSALELGLVVPIENKTVLCVLVLAACCSQNSTVKALDADSLVFNAEVSDADVNRKLVGLTSVEFTPV